jgi:hypothetical protein
MPRVHEVELPVRDLVGDDVVTLDVYIGVDVASEPGDVDVGGEYMAALPDAAGQPVGNSGSACSDLPAPPPLIDTQGFEVSEAHGVKEGGKRVQALFIVKIQLSTVSNQLSAGRLAARRALAEDNSPSDGLTARMEPCRAGGRTASVSSALRSTFAGLAALKQAPPAIRQVASYRGLTGGRVHVSGGGQCSPYWSRCMGSSAGSDAISQASRPTRFSGSPRPRPDQSLGSGADQRERQPLASVVSCC